MRMTPWISLPDLDAIPGDRPVLIAGPTASGKSGLAADIVRRGGGVIVNADALQIYDCWRILSARPTRDEETALPHRLYGHVRRDGPYSAGHWLRDVTEISRQGERPVIVGGTGLYFRALTEGFAVIPAIPNAVRAEADRLLSTEGLARLVSGLDAETAARIDLRNPARVQRAWEVLAATGRGLVNWQADTPSPLLALADVEALVLDPDRDWLNQRIDLRFDKMMAEGALDEVRAELPFWQPDRPASQAIGAAELVAHLTGEITLPEAVRLAKTATHQYAKRQRTWFRSRMKGWKRIALP
jgi:tRNA dimethylallyltransferase